MAIAAYMVVRMQGQTSTLTADFTSAAVAEVRDAQGQVLLRGTFALTDEADDDIERRAILAPESGTASGGRGEAEVEISRNDRAKQEVEFSVENMPRSATLSFSIDGIQVATGMTDDQGRAEIELDVAMPSAAAAR
jgi:hypothetical protein